MSQPSREQSAGGAEEGRSGGAVRLEEGRESEGEEEAGEDWSGENSTEGERQESLKV